MKTFWVCSERYRGSGRPSRVWVIESEASPDTENENGRPYPFNRMGGAVECGPFETEAEADSVADTLVYVDAAGYLQWA